MAPEVVNMPRSFQRHHLMMGMQIIWTLSAALSLSRLGLNFTTFHWLSTFIWSRPEAEVNSLFALSLCLLFVCLRCRLDKNMSRLSTFRPQWNLPEAFLKTCIFKQSKHVHTHFLYIFSLSFSVFMFCFLFSCQSVSLPSSCSFSLFFLACHQT